MKETKRQVKKGNTWVNLGATLPLFWASELDLGLTFLLLLDHLGVALVSFLYHFGDTLR